MAFKLYTFLRLLSLEVIVKRLQLKLGLHRYKVWRKYSIYRVILRYQYGTLGTQWQGERSISG